jgi:sorting nexin-29
MKSTNPKAYWNFLNGQKQKFKKSLPDCETFFDMFKIINEDVKEEAGCSVLDDMDGNCELLDDEITEIEVQECIIRLKNNKACGTDNLINEFFKNSPDKLITIYTKLFNLVLNSGVIPHDWTVGIIKPIFKNKGCATDPNNYRGITLLSCFGKLFTSVLNERLKKYIDLFETLGEEQTGFRNGYSTLDNLFTLYGIIDVLLFKKKRLYCAFLDYEKAFDKVNRAFLWQKLLSLGIKGKFLKIVTNLYEDAKSCVVVNSGRCSDFFQSKVGVRQGENLSPLLFALFLNDLKEFLSREMNGLPTVSGEAVKVNLNDCDVNVFCNLFVLLYADDTVIFSETEAGLQKGLLLIKQYCDFWKLKLNANKCKVIVFSRGKIRNKPSFYIGLDKIEVVSEFTYLGLRLNYNNKMYVAQRDLCNRASRAIFSLIKKSNEMMLPVDIVLDLFEKTVAPILMYGCEVWGFDIIDTLQQTQLKFLKYVLKLKKSTPSVMVFGETGIFPISIAIKSRMLCYWLRLCNNPYSMKLSSVVYRCLYNMYVCNLHKNAYLSSIELILNSIGFSNMWLYQGTLDVNALWFKEKIKRSLK